MERKLLRYPALIAKLVDGYAPEFRGAEIGVLTGRTSAFLLAHFPKLEMLSVDPWCETYNGPTTTNMTQDKYEQTYHDVCKLLERYGDRSQIVRGSSLDAVKLVEQGTLSFVFIDADHCYDSVWDDLSAWYPKVVAGGMLICHDYGSERFPEVKPAFDDFALSKNMPKPRKRPGYIGHALKS
jgi:predicted O-methyltransferase YrrM